LDTVGRPCIVLEKSNVVDEHGLPVQVILLFLESSPKYVIDFVHPYLYFLPLFFFSLFADLVQPRFRRFNSQTSCCVYYYLRIICVGYVCQPVGLDPCSCK
jgi:hypothetical protein